MDNGEDTNREQNVSRRRQRNDDGDEVPKAKRSRVSRACDQCRLSRDKCDGKSPCQTCTASGRDCSYTTNPKKRGIQPGYIRTLESALALLFQRDTGAQKFLSGQLSKGPLRQYVKDGNHSEQLHTIWTNSSVCKQIDAILSGSPSNDFDTSEDLQDGPMSERHASLPEIAATDHSDPYTAAGLATTFHQTSHGNTLNGDAQAPIDLPTNFWNLVDHYYAFTHNWLPISEKNDVLKTAYLYPLRGADPAITQSGTHAELWAIVALSSRQSEPSSSAHRRYTELARSFIPDHDGRYDKGHVRAQILMSLLCVGDGEAAAAWIKIGLASRILTHLGLHRSASGRDTKDRHLVLGCLAVDNMIGLYLDLPGHLSAIYDLRRARVDEDGLEEWTPWQSPSQPGSNAGNGLLNREPGRCLSTFNALVDALRQPEIEPVRHVALSKTPHQLHLELVKVWASYRTARVTHQECLDRMSDLVLQMIGSGGIAAAPPTVAFILRNIQRHGRLGPSAQQLLQRWTSPPLNPPVRQTTENSIQRSVALPSVFGSSSDVHLPPLPNSDNWVNPPSTISAGFRQTVSFGQETAPSNFAQSQQPAYDQINVFDSQRNNLYDGRQSLSMTEVPNNTSNNQDTPSGVSDGGAMNSEFEAIFEEMAQLDASRQMDDGQFMQNLGLGPDSDLRAFFGADYQETDPLLAYLPFDSAGRIQPGPTYPT